MIKAMGAFSDWFSSATRFRNRTAESKPFPKGRAEKRVPKDDRNFPARVFLVLFLVALVVAWSYTLGVQLASSWR